MSLVTETITFALDSSIGVGLQYVQLVNRNLKPKVGIVTCSKNTVDGLTADVNVMIGFFTDDLTQRCVSINSENGGASTDTRSRSSATKVITVVDNDGVVEFEAEVIDIRTGAIVLSITTAPPANYKIHMLLLGGSDITGTHLASRATPATPSIVNYSTPGVNPKVVLFAATGYVGTVAEGGLSYGFMCEDGKQGSNAIQAEDFFGDTNTLRRQVATRCLTIFKVADSVLESEANSNGMISEGFSLNFSIASGIVFFMSLAIEGDFNVTGGNFINTVSVTGKKTQVTGFEPNAAIVTSWLRPASGGTISTLALSLGFVGESGVSATVGSVSEDGVVAVNGYSFEETDGSVYMDYFYDTLEYDDLEFVEWTETGFVLQQTDRDPSQTNNQILWMAFGSSETETPSVVRVPDQNPCAEDI
jgi:hypothetical protein